MKILGSGRHALGFALAIAMLAGCMSAGSSPAQTSNVSPPRSRFQPMRNWFDAGSCKSNHGVSVEPCAVALTMNRPVVQVTTKGPKGGAFSFVDEKCVSGNIAKVEGGGNKYSVLAGAVGGTCIATFIDKEKTGKTIGTAKLSIANFKRNHCPPTC